jgi:hypothetical protein
MGGAGMAGALLEAAALAHGMGNGEAMRDGAPSKVASTRIIITASITVTAFAEYCRRAVIDGVAVALVP